MKSFKMYRIICTVTDTALVGGSQRPNSYVPRKQFEGPKWYGRGQWSASKGTFWSGEETVRFHLRNLCRDWVWVVDPARQALHRYYHGHHVSYQSTVDWSRLEHLRVEQFLVTSHTVTMLSASDFMGIPIESAA